MDLNAKKNEFNRILFRWHRTHYRGMRWRNTRDPYRILISEVMLQQTQVERVRKKYDEFLKRFPTVHDLAKASLGDVLLAWSGLGYNRRAMYLHRCASEVVSHYGGKVPQSETELRRLPGIGISTAAALRAFAFGEDVPMIDTNIRRILSRVFYEAKIPSDQELYILGKQLIPRGKGREWNYAMLDLGATLCTAKNHSGECPFMKMHGVVRYIPHKKPQKKFIDSDRYYRGKIIKYLAQVGVVTKKKIVSHLPISLERADMILGCLIKEGLIRLDSGNICLPK